MSIYDKASLVLIPSGTKTSKVYSQKPTNGDGDFTFSRSTAATRVNASGNIEKQTGNYMLYSQQIDNAYWNKYAFSVTANQATAPDGTTTADLIDDGTNTGIHAIEENETIGFGGVATISIHAKYVDTQYLVLAIYDTSYKAVAFDIQNGTIGNKSLSTLIPTIEDLGNGWYRCAVTHPTNTRNNPFFTFGLRDDDVAGFLSSAGSNRQAYVWGAQMEDGLVARDYIETTTTAIYGGITDNVPRLDYTDSSCPALLLEPQRTNLVGFSEYTDGTNWSNEGSIGDEENTSETTSPEGYYNAVKLVSANATSEQWLQASGLNVTSTGYYTASCFVKKSDYDFFYIRFTGVGGVWGAGGAWFNINTGSVATTESGVTADIVDYGNGWYRVSATKEAVATAFGAVRFQLASSNGSSSVVGDGSKGTYAYGFQVEAGSYATSYIPTYGSAVTRNADVASKTGISSLIGQTEGTLFAEFEIKSTNTDNFNRIIAIGDGTSNNRIMIFANNDEKPRAFISDSGATQVSIIGNTSILGGTHKIAFAYKANDFVLYMDGVSLGTDTSGSVPSLSNIYLASAEDSNIRPIEGGLKQALVFKTRLSNEELATLTTI